MKNIDNKLPGFPHDRSKRKGEVGGRRWAVITSPMGKRHGISNAILQCVYRRKFYLIFSQITTIT